MKQIFFFNWIRDLSIPKLNVYRKYLENRVNHFLYIWINVVMVTLRWPLTPAPELPGTPQKPGSGPVVVQGSNKNAASEKMERVRKWSITTYKVRRALIWTAVNQTIWSITISRINSSSLSLSLQCTRQALSEKLGRGSRTVDLDLEPRLELLKDDRQRYDHVTKLAQTLANQLAQFTDTQKTLGDAFSDLSLKTPTLHVSLSCDWLIPKTLPQTETGQSDLSNCSYDMVLHSVLCVVCPSRVAVPSRPRQILNP